VSYDQRSLLEHGLKHAQGTGYPLFSPSANIRVSIADAPELHFESTAALMREVVERELLPADHRLVREALAAEQVLA
jgi:hypothetical protein